MSIFFQAHGCIHPCHICDAVNTRGIGDWGEGNLRTIGSNMNNFTAWSDTGADLDKAKVVSSVVYS